MLQFCEEYTQQRAIIPWKYFSYFEMHFSKFTIFSTKSLRGSLCQGFF